MTRSFLVWNKAAKGHWTSTALSFGQLAYFELEKILSYSRQDDWSRAVQWCDCEHVHFFLVSELVCTFARIELDNALWREPQIFLGLVCLPTTYSSSCIWTNVSTCDTMTKNALYRGGVRKNSNVYSVQVYTLVFRTYWQFSYRVSPSYE